MLSFLIISRLPTNQMIIICDFSDEEHEPNSEHSTQSPGFMQWMAADSDRNFIPFYLQTYPVQIEPGCFVFYAAIHDRTC